MDAVHKYPQGNSKHRAFGAKQNRNKSKKQKQKVKKTKTNRKIQNARYTGKNETSHTPDSQTKIQKKKTCYLASFFFFACDNTSKPVPSTFKIIRVK